MELFSRLAHFQCVVWNRKSPGSFASRRLVSKCMLKSVGDFEAVHPLLGGSFAIYIYIYIYIHMYVHVHVHVYRMYIHASIYKYQIYTRSTNYLVWYSGQEG